MAHRQFDRIVAVAWLSPAEPIALAQKSTVHKGAYPVTPDGPGVFRSFRVGGLVLLTRDTRIVIDYELKGRDSLHVEDVVARPKQNDFLVKLNVDSSEPGITDRRWLSVSYDGIVSEISIPAAGQPGFQYTTITPDGSKIQHCMRKGTARDSLESQTMELCVARSERENPPWLRGMHGISYRTLSPGLDRIALAGCISSSDGRYCGVWIAAEGSVTLVYQAKSEYIDSRPSFHGPLEEMVVDHRERYGLSWSQDETRLYWCAGSHAQGVVIPLFSKEPPLEDLPCLLQAAWSPDGRQIAGVKSYVLTTLDVGAHE